MLHWISQLRRILGQHPHITVSLIFVAVCDLKPWRIALTRANVVIGSLNKSTRGSVRMVN